MFLTFAVKLPFCLCSSVSRGLIPLQVRAAIYRCLLLYCTRLWMHFAHAHRQLFNWFADADCHPVPRGNLIELQRCAKSGWQVFFTKIEFFRNEYSGRRLCNFSLPLSLSFFRNSGWLSFLDIVETIKTSKTKDNQREFRKNESENESKKLHNRPLEF